MPDGTNDCRFSIIIPVLNEQNQINSVLTHLEKLNCRDLAEVIVVDGDPLSDITALERTVLVIKNGKVEKDALTGQNYLVG